MSLPRIPPAAAAASAERSTVSCSSASSGSSIGFATTIAPSPSSARAWCTSATSSGDSTRHGTGKPESAR